MRSFTEFLFAFYTISIRFISSLAYKFMKLLSRQGFVVVQRICQSKCSAILSVHLNQNRFEISLSMDDSVGPYDKCVVLIALSLLVLSN